MGSEVDMVVVNVTPRHRLADLFRLHVRNWGISEQPQRIRTERVYAGERVSRLHNSQLWHFEFPPRAADEMMTRTRSKSECAQCVRSKVRCCRGNGLGYRICGEH